MKQTLEQRIFRWATMLQNGQGDQALQEINTSELAPSTKTSYISLVRMKWIEIYAQPTQEFIYALNQLYEKHKYDPKSSQFLIAVENMDARDLEVVYGKSRANSQDMVDKYGDIIYEFAKLPVPWPTRFYEFKANELDQREARRRIRATTEVSQNNAPNLDGPIAQKIYDLIVKNGIHSKDPTELLWALLLSSGRRFSEIVALGEFMESNHGSYWVYVLDTAKKRGSKELFEKFHAPLLVPFSLWIRKLAEFREFIKSKFRINENSTANEVSRKTNVYFNRAWSDFLIKTGLNTRLFGSKFNIQGEDVERFTIHKLRALYLSFVLRNWNIGNISVTKFARDILGHDSQGAFMNYLLSQSKGGPLRLVEEGAISMPSQYPQPFIQQQQKGIFNIQGFHNPDGSITILSDSPIVFNSIIYAKNFEMIE